MSLQEENKRPRSITTAVGEIVERIQDAYCRHPERLNGEPLLQETAFALMRKAALARGKVVVVWTDIVRSLAVTCFMMIAGIPAMSAPMPPSAGNGTAGDARDVFDMARGRIYQIQTLTNDGGTPHSGGSGFLVGENGLIATNWHVVAAKILESDRYRLEAIRTDKRHVPVTVVAVDAMNDLALLRAEGETGVPFAIHDAPLEKGDKGFALGNPRNVGFTVIEGIYNGVTDKSLRANFHFTGAINPGMSGGPALTPGGEVFGINVARRDDAALISFVVPAQRLAALIAKPRSANPTPDQLLAEARNGLIQGQERVTSDIMSNSSARRTVGPFVLPKESGSASTCGGSSKDKHEEGYFEESLICYTSIDVFAGASYVGSAFNDYRVIRNRGLDSFRFAARLADISAKERDVGGDPETVHPYSCRTSYVKIRGGTVQATLCTRSYKKVEGLQDAILNVVTVDSNQEGLVGRLSLYGFTDDSVKRLGRWYLETIEWKR
jgi:S1-C subfamily serine protease